MKLMDKIKDLFMDEVIDDDELELEEEEREEYKEPPKKDMPALPKVMRDNIEKEEREEEEKEEKLSFKERLEAKKVPEKKEYVPEVEPEVKPEPPVRKFNFPIDFEEEVAKAEKKEEIPSRAHHSNAFSDLDLRGIGGGNVNVLNMEKEQPKKVAELYPKKEEVKPRFKASPVISPVYGILDKNYTKEEVREKDEADNAIQRPSKKVDFETVRKKAFGNLADEIKDNLLCENCELYKEVKKISALTEDDLLYDMTVDEDKEVTIEKAYDNYREFGVAYEQPKPVKKVPVVEEEEPEIEIPKELEDIINDSNREDEEEEKEPLVIINKKVEVEVIPEVKEEVKEEVEEVPEEEPLVEEEVVVPSREEKKKDTKVDDDFFELIDSMYKERIDE